MSGAQGRKRFQSAACTTFDLGEGALCFVGLSGAQGRVYNWSQVNVCGMSEWMNEWPLHHGWLGLELGLMRAVSSPRKSLLEKGVRVSPGCAMSTEEKQSVIYSGGIPTRYPQRNLVFYGVLRKQVPFLSGNVCCCLCSLYWEEGQCLSLFHTHTHF